MKFNFHSTFYSVNQKPGDCYKSYYTRFIRAAMNKQINEQYALRGIAEQIYYESRRPYYLVYPCIMELVNRLPRETPIRPFVLPGVPTVTMKRGGMLNVAPLRTDIPDDAEVAVQTIALRFVEGSYYDSILVSMTQADGEMFAALHCNRTDKARGKLTLHDSCIRISEDHTDSYKGTLGELVDDCSKATEDLESWQMELKLFACLGLLVDKGLDFLERDLLGRDKGRKDPNAEDRATRIKGLGWTLGRAMEATPHTRRPHFGLRHTGAGRKITKLVPIKGSIVKGKKLVQVPTGVEDGHQTD